jgi:ferredoxin-fold anticodon binding domain-containing protein
LRNQPKIGKLKAQIGNDGYANFNKQIISILSFDECRIYKSPKLDGEFKSFSVQLENPLDTEIFIGKEESGKFALIIAQWLSNV